MKVTEFFDDLSGRAGSAGLTGAWAFYVGALMPLLLGPGIPGLAGFMVALAVGWVVGAGSPAWLRYAAPAAPLLILNFSGSATVAVAAGLLGGAAARSGRRVPASLQGIFAGPGWAGVAEAFLSVVVVIAWGYRHVLVLAAALLLLAARSTSGEEPGVVGDSAAAHAGLSLAFVAGMRLVEVAFGGDPASGLFFVVAWAAGSFMGWRWGETADPRAVLSAPFGCAIALAALGAIRGPATLFLYTAIATVVSFVMRATAETAPGRARELLVVAAALAGTMWAAGTDRSFDTTLWVAGGLTVAGGFMSLISAYRLTTPSLPPQPLPAPTVTGRPSQPPVELQTTAVEPHVEELEVAANPTPLLTEEETNPEEADVAASAVQHAWEKDGGTKEEEEESVRVALQILRDALSEARTIREEALETFHRAPAPTLAGLEIRAAGVVGDLLDEIAALQHKLERIRV